MRNQTIPIIDYNAQIVVAWVISIWNALRITITITIKTIITHGHV
jgi:hypothetical protein